MSSLPLCDEEKPHHFVSSWPPVGTWGGPVIFCDRCGRTRAMILGDRAWKAH